MQIVGSGDHGEQQNQEATQENDGVKATRMPRALRGLGLTPPEQKSRQHQRHPKKIEK
jgi:hypothetical protein